MKKLILLAAFSFTLIFTGCKSVPRQEPVNPTEKGDFELIEEFDIEPKNLSNILISPSRSVIIASNLTVFPSLYSIKGFPFFLQLPQLNNTLAPLSIKVFP